MITTARPRPRLAASPVALDTWVETRVRAASHLFDDFGMAVQRANAPAAAIAVGLPTRPVSEQAGPAVMATSLHERLPDHSISPKEAMTK